MSDDRSFYTRLKWGLDTKYIFNNLDQMFNRNFNPWDMKRNSLIQEPFLKMSSPLSWNWNSQRYNESVYTQSSLERRRQGREERTNALLGGEIMRVVNRISGPGPNDIFTGVTLKIGLERAPHTEIYF